MTADHAALRESLVDEVRARGGPISAPVVEALRAVPRHLFLPDIPVESAYRDRAIVTKVDPDGLPVSSSSQPTMMAIMLEQLAVTAGQRVLEIGAGTGYNAALLAHLVGPGGEVVSVDIDADLVEAARVNVRRAGYPAVRLVRGDGAEGYPERAPYDRVIATVGVWDLAPAWLAQLAPDGVIVVPLDLRGVHRSVAFGRANGHWTSRSVVPCGFIRMRGALAGPDQTRALDPVGRLALTVADLGRIDPDALLGALAGPYSGRATGVTITPAELFDGLSLWLAVHDHRWCELSEAATVERPRLEFAPLRMEGARFTIGVADGEHLAVLEYGPDAELGIRGYGPHPDRLAVDLAAHVHAWDAAGRPATAGLRVDAYPKTTAGTAASGRLIEKRHTRLALSWPGAGLDGEPGR